MGIKLNDKFLTDIITKKDISGMQERADKAFSLLKEGNGPGNDFI
jgi:hypothetical protein